MTAHEFCSQECPCGHWKPGHANKNRVVQPRKGRVTIDVYDGLPDPDATNYRDYEEDD